MKQGQLYFKNHSHLFLIWGLLSHVIFCRMGENASENFLFFALSEKPPQGTFSLECFILVTLGKQGPDASQSETVHVPEVGRAPIALYPACSVLEGTLRSRLILISLPQFEEAGIRCQ